MKKFVLLALLFALGTASVQAGIIKQDDSDAGKTLSSLVGQSFTAEDTNVIFGLYIYSANSHERFDENIHFTLFEGETLSGTVLSKQIVKGVAPQTFDEFFEVDFSNVNLTVGSLYTVGFEGGSRWGFQYNRGAFEHTAANLYDGGKFLMSGPRNFRYFPEQSDARFMVRPSAQPPQLNVPAPATFGLFSLALLAVALRRKA